MDPKECKRQRSAPHSPLANDAPSSGSGLGGAPDTPQVQEQVPRKRRVVTCKTCGQQGHIAKTCGRPFFSGAAAPGRRRRQQAHAECSICNDTQHKIVVVSHKCTHAPVVCVNCLARHIDTSLNGKVFSEIVKCPTCVIVMTYEDIRIGAKEKVFQRYDRLLCMQFLEKDPDFRHCKTASCGGGQLHERCERIGANIMTCYFCKGKQCFDCDVPWHVGKTCAEYKADVDRSAVRQTEDFLRARTKQCPQCSMRFQKIGTAAEGSGEREACDHITCAKCKFEFCYQCGADYRMILDAGGGNHRHKPECKWFAAFDDGDDDDDDDDEDDEDDDEDHDHGGGGDGGGGDGGGGLL